MSQKRLGRHLTPPLARPQYVSVPEGFITALAWHYFDTDEVAGHKLGRGIGLRYRGDALKKKVTYVITEPEVSDLDEFGKDLLQSGITVEAQPRDLASAVTNSLLGIRAPKGTFQPISPLTPAMALMQNMVGIQGAAQPPDLSGILETMFSFGLPNSEDQRSASKLWASACETRLGLDPLLKTLSRSLEKNRFSLGIQVKDRGPVNREFAGIYESGPFSWFVSAWSNLTSPAWTAALPARVWSDWACTVLRMVFGMGYLWEAAWYEVLARRILQPQAATWDEIESNLEDLLPWQSSSSGVQSRDVASRVKWRIHRSYRIRETISKWIVDKGMQEHDVDDVLSAMGQDAELRYQLRGSLSSNSTPADNALEAVRYALMVRESRGQFADYYGLLKSRGTRYLVPEPGIEWLAVVTSLASQTPGASIHLADVTLALEMLGTRPDRQDLVMMLEEAGLARGSADADQGVSVATAY
jgi:hypothetical protein